MIHFDKKKMALLIFAALASIAAALLPPQILKVIIDRYLLAGKSDGLLAMGLIYLGGFFLIGIFDFVKALLLTDFGQSVVMQLRNQMQKKMERLPSAYFTGRSSGEIHSLFMTNVENISSLFTDGIVSLLADCLKIVGIVISIWLFSWRLGVFALAVIPAAGFLTWLFRRAMAKSQKDNLIEIGKVNSHLNESINNLTMIKSFAREEFMEDRFDGYLEENYRTMKRVNFYDSCYSPIIQMLTAFSAAFILYLSAGGRVSVLGITIGEIAASIELMTSLFAPIDSLGMEINSIEKGMSAVRSVKAFLAEPEDRAKRMYSSLFREPVKIELNHVNFSYDGKTQIIRDFHAEISPGENVAIIGRTGAGKSTLFKLITGLLSPDSGQVLLNGIPADEIAAEGRRKIFGYVQQDFSFIEGNLYDQISLGDSSLTREQIENAIELAGLKEKADSLTEGFDTKIKPEMFSQGERQLLAIARAVAANPKVLLLDEVTANLDSITEEKIVQVLARAGEGRTILSIAHRPSTIAKAERIIKI